MSLHDRPLSAPDLALAAVMSSTAVGLAVLGWLLPHAGALQILAAVPMGVVAHRSRLRALVAATVGGASVAFLIGGSGPTWSVLTCAFLGGVVGEVKRRNGSWRLVFTLSIVAGFAAAAVADLVLLLFGEFRTLTLESVRSLVFGATSAIRHLRPLRPLAATVEVVTTSAITHWWISAAAAVLIGMVGAMLLTWCVLGAVLDRLAWLPIEVPLPHEKVPARATSPLPVRLSGVGFRYEGASTDALSDIDLTILPSEFVVLTGRNGSGKSTLARLLAGHAPNTGVVERRGAVGLGQVGGTAWIGQRPEGQILGATVADDVVWGLPSTVKVDVAGLLSAVGLDRLADRSTSTLSGGELQRLAVAAALARRPALLISDESTAMVDAAGRGALMDLLHALPAQGTAVVHVTHDVTEIAATDRVLRLERGRLIVPGPERAVARQVVGAPAPDAAGSGEPLIRLRNLGYVYAAGTPWQQTALTNVNLDLAAGDGLLVVGGNGSGKSTLAWIVAGLTRPTSGSVLIDGRPPLPRSGTSLLAFQHSRLQVQGRDVRSELASAPGSPSPAAILATVGLEQDLVDRPVDQLSGGQLRRVALAGLIARRPRLLILDEPLAGLDAFGRLELLELLARARSELGLTLIVISHDNVDMHLACSHVLELAHGQLRPLDAMSDVR